MEAEETKQVAAAEVIDSSKQWRKRRTIKHKKTGAQGGPRRLCPNLVADNVVKVDIKGFRMKRRFQENPEMEEAEDQEKKQRPMGDAGGYVQNWWQTTL